MELLIPPALLSYHIWNSGFLRELLFLFNCYFCLIDVDTNCVLEILSNLDSECTVSDEVTMVAKEASNLVSGIIGGVVTIVTCVYHHSTHGHHGCNSCTPVMEKEASKSDNSPKVSVMSLFVRLKMYIFL